MYFRIDNYNSSWIDYIVMNEIEKLEEKLKRMDKAYFNRIKKCENIKEKLQYLNTFELLIIILLGLVIYL